MLTLAVTESTYLEYPGKAWANSWGPRTSSRFMAVMPEHRWKYEELMAYPLGSEECRGEEWPWEGK